MKISRYLYEMRGLMQIERYQNKFRFKPRTTAEHQWAVAKIAQALTLWNNKISDEKADMGEVLTRSVLNGTIKLFTGEIQSNTKNASEDMVKAVREVNEIVYDTKYGELLPEDWVDTFKEWVLNAKDTSSVEGKIVMAASIIDVILEAYEEIELGNTRYFLGIFNDNMLKLSEIDLEIVRWFWKVPIEELVRTVPDSQLPHIDAEQLSKIIAKESFKTPNTPEAIEFRNTFFNYIYEIRGMMSIKRYQNIFRNKKRTVAEHEWSTVLIALCIGLETEKSYGVKVDFSELLQTALSHDDIEIFSGDILSHTKRTTEKISKAVEKVELDLFREMYLPMIPIEWRESFIRYVLFPKSEPLIGEIMSAADIIDTMFESIEEIRIGNGDEFSAILKNAHSKIFEIKLPVLKTLRLELIQMSI